MVRTKSDLRVVCIALSEDLLDAISLACFTEKISRGCMIEELLRSKLKLKAVARRGPGRPKLEKNKLKAEEKAKEKEEKVKMPSISTLRDAGMR